MNTLSAEERSIIIKKFKNDHRVKKIIETPKGNLHIIANDESKNRYDRLSASKLMIRRSPFGNGNITINAKIKFSWSTYHLSGGFDIDAAIIAIDKWLTKRCVTHYFTHY